MTPPKGVRTRSAGTKLTEEEYGRLEAAAGKCGLTVGEWCRKELLQAVDGNGSATFAASAAPESGAIRTVSLVEEILLAEVLALRTILLNLVYDLAAGEPVDAERMRQLIAKADGEKREKASSRLQAASVPPSEGAA